ASKMVYQLPQLILRGNEPGPSKYVPFRLYNHGGEAMLHYSQSAGISGRDYTIRLNADGSFTEAAYHSIVNTFGDKAFSFSAAADYGANNLKMKVGNGEYRDVGDPAYVFGWSWQGGRAGTTPVDAVELVGDELYILGYEWNNGDALNGLYRVNINTNATTRVTPRHVLYFQRDGDYLYYASGEGARSYEGHDSVYRYSLQDGREELVLRPAMVPAAIKNIAVLNGHVYWQSSDTTALYDAKGAALNPGGICESMVVVGDKEKYLACTFEETPDSRYRLMVFDRGGGLVFKTSDVAYPGSIVIEGRELYYYNIVTKTVCHHALP
ncbi:MAG: DUF5050 domain-containing protein, partial [Syntrophomonadaceae bacterium]|nr:DUF5050 domain-containing protein [Syntrophomonadaceae bacterium]